MSDEPLTAPIFTGRTVEQERVRVLLDAAYCRAKHAGEHLGRPQGCGSWCAADMARDPELLAALDAPDEGLDVERLAPLLGREFGKAGFFSESASAEFLTNQARLMLAAALDETRRER